MEPLEKLKIDITVGQATHDNHLAALRGRYDEAWKTAALALTTLATLNSGPLIAMLALAASMLEGKVKVPREVVVGPVIWFSLGLGTDLLAMFAGFFAITSFIRHLEEHDFRLEHPYVVPRDGADQFRKQGNRIRVSAIVLAVISLGCAGIGAYNFIEFATQALNVADGTTAKLEPKPKTTKTPPAEAAGKACVGSSRRM